MAVAQHFPHVYVYKRIHGAYELANTAPPAAARCPRMVIAFPYVDSSIDRSRMARVDRSQPGERPAARTAGVHTRAPTRQRHRSALRYLCGVARVRGANRAASSATGHRGRDAGAARSIEARQAPGTSAARRAHWLVILACYCTRRLYVQHGCCAHASATMSRLLHGAVDSVRGAAVYVYYICTEHN